MSVAALLSEADAAGVALEVAGDKLRYRAARPPPSELIERLRSHKSELLSLLAADLPGRVRRRFSDTCTRLQVDAAVVLTQFDRWQYSREELCEMERWPDEVIEAHARLLITETHRVEGHRHG